MQVGSERESTVCVNGSYELNICGRQNEAVFEK